MMRPGAWYQVWQSPSGTAHIVRTYGAYVTGGFVTAVCRRPWPVSLTTWIRVDDDAPVTCDSCRRSSYARVFDNDVAVAGKG